MDVTVGRWVALYLACALLLAALKAVKYAGWRKDTGLSWDDAWLLALAVLGSHVPGWTGHLVGAGLGALLGTTLLLALWLDVVLFRVFTIELGPGGVGTVVVAQLYRELSQIAWARRFFAEHGVFALLPVAAACAFMPLTGRADLVRSGLLCAYLGTLLVHELTRARLPWALWLLLAGVTAWRASGEATPWLVPSAASVMLLGLLALLTRKHSPSLIREFIFPRPLPRPHGFQPRPEHESLCRPRATPLPARSGWHGMLRGSSVILVTVESMGRSHFSAASMPFLGGNLEDAVQSQHHFCVSPTTNNAHLALYAGDYTAHGKAGGLVTLLEAGYQAVYLTADDTAHYGLKPILESAGFTDVVDCRALGATRLTDDALRTVAVDRLESLLVQDQPFFLHVHTTNTHVPYHVADRARFNRFDHQDDRGRFLNGLEETDWILSSFMGELARRGLVEEPLIVVTGDHGQAFGRHGYHSHGSAVTAEQLTVPFIMRHPLLPPRVIPHSSHFDVLPTVLDLLGVAATPSRGQSLFLPRPPPALFVHAGHPSRTSTSNFGVIDGDRKFMLELINGRCCQMDWNDDELRELDGAEKRYVSALLAQCLVNRGLV